MLDALYPEKMSVCSIVCGKKITVIFPAEGRTIFIKAPLLDVHAYNKNRLVFLEQVPMFILGQPVTVLVNQDVLQ